jgi:molybdopterin-guanine dinucleotide biosynthesis protein A
MKGYVRSIEAEAFVLAGGRSSRMGQDKALLLWQGRTLLDVALDKLESLPLAAAPRIAGARSDLSSYGAVIADIHPECGPLSGIEAALAASSQPWNVFLPVDLPLLPSALLRSMLLRTAITGALVTIPRFNGRPQPLCAVYHRDLVAGITASIEAGQYKVMAAVMTAARQIAGPEAVDLFNAEAVASTDFALLASSPLPLYRWFHNCNTPEDLLEML